mmetsp:Transcript_24977/g.62481  ORF Transcript_24977/g.62481 Transcript_24977/m.62481 type:complete len:299 (+) Transcript_24977:647-1543(+)
MYSSTSCSVTVSFCTWKKPFRRMLRSWISRSLAEFCTRWLYLKASTRESSSRITSPSSNRRAWLSLELRIACSAAHAFSVIAGSRAFAVMAYRMWFRPPKLTSARLLVLLLDAMLRSSRQQSATSLNTCRWRLMMSRVSTMPPSLLKASLLSAQLNTTLPMHFTATCACLGDILNSLRDETKTPIAPLRLIASLFFSVTDAYRSAEQPKPRSFLCLSCKAIESQMTWMPPQSSIDSLVRCVYLSRDLRDDMASSCSAAEFWKLFIASTVVLTASRSDSFSRQYTSPCEMHWMIRRPWL